MAAIALVIVWAVAEAAVAIALVARPGSRMPRPTPTSMFAGLVDWRL